MSPEALNQVLSSKVRVRIADAVSVRPRTLKELASITGISVPGVLRHLKGLMKLGLVEERRISKMPKARTVYSAKDSTIGDYSIAGLTIVKSTKRPQAASPVAAKSMGLESMSGDLLFQRRRIAVLARRLGKQIDELVEGQADLSAALERAPLDDAERLILQVLLTEETLADGVRVLSRYYGIEDRRSIDKALALAKRNVGKQ